MQSGSYVNVSPALVDTSLTVIVHILYNRIIPLWDAFRPETPPYQFTGYSVVCLLQIYDDHV